MLAILYQAHYGTHISKGSMDVCVPQVVSAQNNPPIVSYIGGKIAVTWQ